MDYTHALRKYAMDSHKEYDEEPVVYCTDCLSLKIMKIGNRELCDECGGTEFRSSDIF